MARPFEAFVSPLSWQQISLLLDTVQYFEDAPKLLSIPNEQGESIAVPITGDTLHAMLACLDESEAFARKPFFFDWEEAETEGSGTVIVRLPNAETVRQEAVLSQFSPV